MSLRRANLFAVLFALTASAALADLKPEAELLGQSATVSVSALLAADGSTHSLDLWPNTVAGEKAIEMSLASARLDGSDRAVLRELHERPSSLSLYLSVLIGVGGWHFVRSARQFDMSAAPDWYHTGGPVQVGHVTPLDISFGTPLLCAFEPVAVHRSFIHRIRLAKALRLESRVCPLLAAPRGPPRSV